ncbi:LAME_0H01222g1_1 [Lachancea meyersii CBS 8951]|uniref:LAME_0H01222g1_1 n=1 Tax=Lachancea meyersii CBS 8951 TaxID=1266667 RepID=A0A1G4KDA3_9SACH|nr:LAME_0H01222g1_1 [Lachancea meyersii CBS 8951]
MASEAAWPQRRGNLEFEDAIRCKYVTKNTQLGDGCFSVVKECMNMDTRDLFAMKLISKKTVQGKLWLIQREVSLLKDVSRQIRELEIAGQPCTDTFEGHHHVLQLFDYFETSQHIVLVTQLCDHGDLYENIIEAGSLDLTRQVKPYTACLLSAINFLHANGVVHRDVKAENVIFRRRVSELDEFARRGSNYDHTSHDLVLADFGLATRLDGSKDELRECVGTTSYLAPEVMKCQGIARLAPSKQNEIAPYGALIDVWALGVLTYFMMTGYMPFDCDTDDETRKCIQEGDYYVEDALRDDSNTENKLFWNFVHLCFNVNAEDRPSARDLRKHPFVHAFFHDEDTVEPFGDRIALRKSISSSSLHKLQTPSRSASFSSIAHLGRLDSGHDMKRTGSRGPDSEPFRETDRDAELNRVRETLKKTLSMTSVRPLTRNSDKDNSTFTLAPLPPVSSLMNGCLSLTPESKSNFNTSPCLSRTASTNDVSWPASSTTAETGAEANFSRKRGARFDV